MKDNTLMESDNISQQEKEPSSTKTKRRFFILFFILLSLFLIIEAVGYYLSIQDVTAINPPIPSKKRLDNMERENDVLRKQISGLSPKGIYIIIDTAKNRLFLKKNGTTLLEAVVSTGSGSILEDPTGKRRWVFDTPRGVLTVQGKKVNPVWVKPDWAFIEEGEPIPKSYKERVEKGVLGDYGLELGNDYLIHGTLYTRLLGRNVTHGCVRVGDKDLKTIYENTPIGTKVIIF